MEDPLGDSTVAFVLGLGVALVVGLTVRQIRTWLKKWEAIGKPQKGEVVTKKGELVSKKTPWQVMVGGFQGGCLIVMTLILMAVVLWLVLGAPR